MDSPHRQYAALIDDADFLSDEEFEWFGADLAPLIEAVDRRKAKIAK